MHEDDDKEDTTIVEGVLLPRSPLIGHSLRSLEFKERYGLQVLALHRAGRRAQDHQLGAPAHGRRAAAAGNAART